MNVPPRPHLLAVVASALVLQQPGVSWAQTRQSPAAPESVEQADTAWAEGRYADAAKAYAEAYAETGDIAYVYARAQAQQAAGDCHGAISTYEAFIATEPVAQASEAAASAIAACRETLPPDPEPVVTPVEPTPAQPPTTAPPPPRDQQRWQRDPTGALLIAFGGASLTTGVALAVIARSNQATADRAQTVEAYGEHNERAATLSRVSIPVMVVGGALVLGGVLRYVLVARRLRRTTTRTHLDRRLVVRF
ncbi:MAG: hypothetical protein JKY37_06130 [Nannocystaceae bacterium]|nr:hypothetical protein [Nannocystaceae bacterium]